MIFSPSVYQTTRHTLAHINDITNIVEPILTSLYNNAKLQLTDTK